ncbi:exodeoxyribonuclease VII small subunit [Spirochaeta isovalerica]|uniref:Exodeoxyribonuclease 7 small subunit n=1 Tax=Spirochaeta isovalerica TaxID=150 RepID=A0A841R706_9SPIO|nr:exodeoxyribonuclease VII small subunit [Spirochaeta isovalerica]MBB6479161.1 exodeoxyribonuclease VII small subunit [Spirochaeta isovalerica]
MKEKKFEEKLSELEEISRKIKSGELPLDETVANFERGMKLAGDLEKEISSIERKVEILVSDPGEQAEFTDFPEE